MVSYKIHPDCDIPIYKQLVDAIHADIQRGVLPAETKLPTVREMAGELGLACGTIKRAYDELENLGDLEMTRGRGTFVRYRQEDSESRKERAMAAIDKMLDRLEELGFTTQEMEIFIDIKLQEKALRSENLHVALVECNQEVLFQLTEQLHVLRQVDLYQYLVKDVSEYPYEISNEMDIIVTTGAHYDELVDIIPNKEKLLKVALRLPSDTVLQIAKLGAGQRVTALCHSTRFGRLLQKAVDIYATQSFFNGIHLFENTSNIQTFLTDVDVVLVPDGYEKYCGAVDRDRLIEFTERHKLISCGYQIDQGSYMYLEDRVNKLLLERGKMSAV
ncbi:MAG: GntR family transcriptional regulator [Clostridia bacterium]